MGPRIRSRRDIVRYLAQQTAVALSAAVTITTFGCLAIGGFDLAHTLTIAEALRFGIGLAATIVLVLTPLMSLRSALTYRTMNQLRDKFEALAHTDPLTGLNNRRGFDEDIRRLPQGRPAAALMCDLDHFKRVNDVHGHDVGDAVLRAAAELLAELAAMRPSAIVARYGGEEFAIVLPNASLTEARLWGETVRTRFASRPIASPHGAVRVTMSLGIAATAAFDGDFAALISRADQSLYRAKREGRNRVALAREEIVAADVA